MTYAKLDRDREEISAGGLCDGITTLNTREIDEAGLNNALLTLGGLDHLLSKPESSVGHGQSGRTSALLCLDDLVTTELDTVYERIELLGGNADAGLCLAEERDNGFARMATNDGDAQLSRVLLAGDLRDECFGANDVQRGDTKELLRVKNTSFLENLSGNGDGRVDGVGDDEDECLGAVLGDTLNQTLDDAGVDLEEVVTGHSRLAYVV